MTDLDKQKSKMWSDKMAALEKELSSAMLRKGEAAQMGDLRENSAYQEAINDIEVLQSRIANIKLILADLAGEKGEDAKSGA